MTNDEPAAADASAVARAVLFDMDGVIVDSEDFWHAFEREELFDRALADVHPDLDEVTGMNYREIYDYLDEGYETTVEKDEFVGLYDERAREIYGESVELMDEFADLCDALRADGLRVGVVSSAPREWIEIVLDRFDLGEFDLVMSVEEIDGDGKPEPAVYEAAAADLTLEPGECAVVEDSENGAAAADRAGAHVIGYRVEHNAETDLSRADVIVEGADELREELERLGGNAPGYVD